MAIGALGSIYLYNNGPSKIQAINKYIIIGFLLFVIWFSYQHFYLTQFYNEIHGILFTFVLLIIATRPKIANLLENRISIFLGNISYGIYMLHMVVVVFSATYLKFLWANNPTLESFILLELFVITVTIFISWISYTFFEKRFLSLKKKFTKVQSG
jgi:peptidoglycan/LPS O-acetylase OafA/YrhL